MTNEEAIKQLEFLIKIDFHVDTKEACRTAISALEKQINGGWIKCSERLPSEEECVKSGGNLFEVTKIINKKIKITDYCLIHTDYKTWHIRLNEEVIAWKYKSEPYKESEETKC